MSRNWREEGQEGVSLGKGFIKAQTDKAILVVFDSGEEMWIPQSCVHGDSEVWEKGQAGPVTVLRWWATKEGLV